MSDPESAGWRAQVPERLGRYRLDAVLGRGAMGVVYRGFDEAIEREVAIKTIHAELIGSGSGSDAEFHERFRREARAAARCQHANIVTIFEFGEQEGLPYIVMEYITGPTLQDTLAANSWPKLSRSLSIVRQTLSAIGYAHGKGIIHRDLKPSNIMLVEGDRVKVTDFGIARVDRSAMTQQGAVIGTPGYMSIEQFRGGAIDERSDLFSIGVILYQLVTGCMPFEGESLPQLVYQMMTVEPPEPALLNPTIPPVLNDIVKKAIAREPEARYQTAAEFSSALFPGTARSGPPSAPSIPRAPVSSPSLARPGSNPRGQQPPPGPSSRPGAPPTPDAPPLSQHPAPGGAPPAYNTPPPSNPRGTPLPGSLSISDAQLAKVIRDLTMVLGPIAPVLVKKSIGKVSTLADLYRALAVHITDERERAAFLRGAAP